MSAFLEKYPIGTQWKDASSNRCVVLADQIVWHGDDRLGTVKAHMGDASGWVLGETSYDLIEPWTEPKRMKVDVWLNVYATCVSSLWPSKAEADRVSDAHRIACIHIESDVVVGEGL